jgi:hypothetical protein
MNNSFFESFEGEDIEFVEHAGELGVTTACLAKIFKMEERRINEILTRNFQLLEGLTFKRIMRSAGKSRSFQCLKRDGVLTLITLLDYKRYPPEFQDKIIRFRRWMIGIVGQVIDGKLTGPEQQPALPTKDRFTIHKQISDLLVSHGYLDRSLADLTLINIMEEREGEDLGNWKTHVKRTSVLPAPSLTSSEIAKELTADLKRPFSAREVNTLLKDMGYQKWLESKKWEPTTIGKIYGEYIPIDIAHGSGSRHRGYQWKWRVEVIEKIISWLDDLERMPKQQTLLLPQKEEGNLK